MKTEGKILIVDDDEDILTAARLLLKRQFTHVSICNVPENIPTFLADQQFDAILLDMNFGPGESSGAQGFYWLKKILEISPNSVIIMITAHGGVDVAVDAMKLGATDFIAKPWQNEKLIATISAAVMLGQSRSETQKLRATNNTLVQVNNLHNKQSIIGDSSEIKHIHSLIQRAAPTDANVLILGENGTGKELIAREIHNQSLRANSVFMSVDLGAISETLFESELFGHTKGAYTGAQQDRIGRLKAADGGTLFLDEIGNLPLYLQAKLLTVLEQRTVTPLGSNKSIPFDVRIISATNVEKSQLKLADKFRQDLLFRLNTVEISLPSLRERISDIDALLDYYLALYCQKYHKPMKTLTPDVLAVIKSYTWPGNIRELRHGIERAVILSQSSQLTVNDFQLSTENTKKETKTPVLVTNDLQVQLPQALNLETIEKQVITAALKKHRYNISHTAKELGLTRAALYRRMEKHGL